MRTRFCFRMVIEVIIQYYQRVTKFQEFPNMTLTEVYLRLLAFITSVPRTS